MIFYEPSKLLKRFEGYDRPNELISSNESSELILVRGLDRNEDPRYYLLVQGENSISSSDLKVVFGINGMLESIIIYEDKKPSTLIERKSAAGNFFGQSIHNIDSLIDSSYNLVHQTDISGKKKDLFEWDYNKLKKRFQEFNSIVDNKIIPDYEDNTLPFFLGSNCRRKCGFCKYSLSGDYFFVGEKRLEKELSDINSALQNWHSGFETSFSDGFLSTPDILKHILNNGEDPLKLIPKIYSAFPHLQKFGTFVGLESIVHLSKENPSYLTDISKWVSRWYSGIETTHQEYSFAIGKKIPREIKIEGMRIASSINHIKKRKWVVMVGFGPGVRAKDGKVYYTEDSIRKTANDIINNSGMGFYTVEISRFDPKGTLLEIIEKKRAKEGSPSILLPYTDPEKEIEAEIKLYRDLFRGKVDITTNIRPGYEAFLP